MPSPSRAGGRRLPQLRWILLGACLVLVALALLALPFRNAPAEAEAARADLETAKDALTSGNVSDAKGAVKNARTHVDALQDSVQGIGGDVWSWIPLAGGPVRDVRHLGNAVDDLTSLAESGVRVWPKVSGDESTLLDKGNVDLDTLASLTEVAREASARVASAQAELDAVGDNRLLVGTMLASKRDEAQDRVRPLADGVETLDPLLDVLPQMLGSDNDKKYLVALLNPSEMQYSGGTPLTFMTLGFKGGKMTMDEPIDVETSPELRVPRYWIKVAGNRFHRGQMKPIMSTQAPDWSVSGNELANAWRSLRGRRLSGVIAADAVALANLMEVTGPVDLPGIGTVSSETFVQKIVGEYDKYADPALMSARKETNRALAQLFSDQLLSGADPIKVGQSLGKSADGRHFAVYFRNPDEQAVFDELGVTGRLADTDHDYLGVFTQNRVPSKADYWQRRAVRSDVTVREDGSARVRLAVRIHNDSPPYVQPWPDSGSGYYTRWNNLSVLTMLPEGAKVSRGTVDGTPFPIQMGTFYGRPYQRENIEFAPQSTHTLEIVYDVPVGATVNDDGSLAYSLHIDPQGMVTPQAVDVRVRFPEGFAVGDLPAGWSTGGGGRTATFSTPGLTASESFELEAHP